MKYIQFLGLWVNIRRDPWPYLKNYYLPSMLVVLIGSFSFIMPPQAIPGRTTLLITTILLQMEVLKDAQVNIRMNYLLLAIRDGAFGACSLRGLPAAGSLRSPLPLALALHLHTLSSTIKISIAALFRFLSSGGLGGHRLNSPRYDEKLSYVAFSKNGLEWPQFAPI